MILDLTTSVLVTERNAIPVCETAESMPNRREFEDQTEMARWEGLRTW